MRAVANDPDLQALKQRMSDLGWRIEFKKRRLKSGVKYYFRIQAIATPSEVVKEVQKTFSKASMTSGAYGCKERKIPCDVMIAEC